MNELKRSVQQAQPRFFERLRTLVELESPSGDAGAIERAGAMVSGWAEALGGRAVRHAGGDYGSVLELWFGPEPTDATAGTTVLLLGHLDTVWPVGALLEMPWREAGGKLFGPGVVDMKAGVMMALEAVAALRDTGALRRPVCLLLNPDEEVGSPVSRAHTERLAREVAAVLVLEPAQGLAYKTARKGVGQWELRVRGVGAHAGVDFAAGHSAIREAARLVEEVSNWSDLERGLTTNVGVLAGGTRSNVVAEECRAEVDVRVVTMEQAEEVAERFAALRASDSACSLEVRGGMNRPPMERSEGTVRLFRTAQRLASELGFSLDEAATGGGSDGNFTAALGVPTLDGMGAVGGGAHARTEHVVRAHLTERTALLAGMIASVEVR